MEQYIKELREIIVAEFNKEVNAADSHARNIRIKLSSGDWVDGGLVSNTAATFTIEVSSEQLGRRYKRLEIPYLQVEAIETVFDLE
ncbi:MAG: hypothetical protein AAGK67_00155 [Pseudomonadota bacterium]